jgi:hypothetical protein
MNWKKFFIAFIAAFVFIFVFGFIWHGKLMNSAYMEIQTHWRTDADFNAHFPVLIFGHVVMAFFLTCIYARFVSTGGPGAGAKLGAKIGLIFVGLYFIRFAVEPLTTKILVLGSIADVIMFAIAGAIVGAIYKPAIITTTP